ncbi:MAG: Rap1a/Tai family immunity protein [Gammaproteobacteria bacterium]|nr:Rap1a/Tai family immunity protein [Gammaproteobacteria bacterium]
MKIVSYVSFSVFLSFVLVNIAFAEENTGQEKYFPQQMSAKDLMTTCAATYMTSLGRQRKKYCAGFISGVEESTRLLTGLTIEPKICFPKGKTASQYADIYISYASRKTTQLSKPAALVVIESFQDAFPCQVAD